MKKHFLKKFLCTEEGFRERFRSAKPESEESFPSFLLRLTHYFDRWVELAKIDKDFVQLRALLLKEQILHCVSKDLAVFLKEREFSTLQDLADTAERFREAHPGKNMSRSRDTSLFVSSVSQNVPQHFRGVDHRRTWRGATHERGNGFTQASRGGHHDRAGFVSQHSGQSVYSTQGSQRGTSSGFGSGVQRGFPHSTSKRASRRRGGRGPTPSDICRKCGGAGHWSIHCPSLDVKFQPAAACKVLFSLDVEQSCGRLQLHSGLVGDQKVSVLRDTGCTTAGIRKSLVSKEQYTGEVQRCVSFGGHIEIFQLAKIFVRTPFFAGEVVCCVIEDPVADLILGNLPGVLDTPLYDDSEEVALAVTRLQQEKQKEAVVPLPTPVPTELQVDRGTLSRLQQEDGSLQDSFDKARDGSVVTSGTATVCFKVKEDILYRSFKQNGEETVQIVVPQSLRAVVLATAHDNIMAGHCGVRRTLQRVLLRFFWPHVRKDVSDYCRTCDVCQKTVSKGKVHPVPLGKMPVVETPFKRIAIDLIGPFKPISKNGYRYVLTVMDVATRFPDAVPLRNVDTVSVAEALMGIFSRVGYPEEILSDCGTQFVSGLMKEIYRLLSIKCVHTSPYHPQANGLVERFNGTLKTMLKKVVHSHPEHWDRYIPALLFAYRELPCESTGFSPFELLYGRRPRGPIDLLAQSWSGDSENDSSKPLLQYVIDLKNVLADSVSIAQNSLEKSAKKYKSFHDRKAVSRSFEVGDEVLVLLPSDTNKLLIEWRGPFNVTEVLDSDYRIQMGKTKKIFHANMLQKYHRRVQNVDGVPSVVGVDAESRSCRQSSGTSIGFQKDLFPFPDSDVQQFVETDADFQVSSVGVIQSDEGDEVQLTTIPSVQGETVRDIHIDEKLNSTQRTQLEELFSEFSSVFTDKPGTVSGGVVHEIHLTSQTPIRLKPYPLPFASREIVAREMDTMMDLGVIEPSQSPYSSPIVLVRKKDGTTRFCIDFRALNKITVFDAEPIPDIEDLFCRLSGGRYFTKIDLAKGYWQIPVRHSDKEKTAFQTPQGLFQWTRMPFGLVTAPATFARMMRSLALDRFSSFNFFDDILCSSVSWQEHLGHVRGVLQAVSRLGLTIRPSKMFAGFQELEFLGHVVSEGILKPQEDKVKKVLEISKPRTKKQVRSLLGLAGYYRRFIPDFATLASPLSDLTRNTSSKQIVWSDECDVAFQRIQNILTSEPILRLPDLSQQFVVRTDASNTGVGAVLMQTFEGLLHPVVYISRKLLDRERKYSTIERECLALVWAINKLSRYLWGREFVLQTDHRPLTFLTSGQFKNGRLIRWALSLQEFRFKVESVPGRENVLADSLSRSNQAQQIP